MDEPPPPPNHQIMPWLLILHTLILLWMWLISLRLVLCVLWILIAKLRPSQLVRIPLPGDRNPRPRRWTPQNLPPRRSTAPSLLARRSTQNPQSLRAALVNRASHRSRGESDGASTSRQAENKERGEESEASHGSPSCRETERRTGENSGQLTQNRPAAGQYSTPLRGSYFVPLPSRLPLFYFYSSRFGIRVPAAASGFRRPHRGHGYLRYRWAPRTRSYERDFLIRFLTFVLLGWLLSRWARYLISRQR